MQDLLVVTFEPGVPHHSAHVDDEVAGSRNKRRGTGWHAYCLPTPITSWSNTLYVVLGTLEWWLGAKRAGTKAADSDSTESQGKTVP